MHDPRSESTMLYLSVEALQNKMAFIGMVHSTSFQSDISAHASLPYTGIYSFHLPMFSFIRFLFTSQPIPLTVTLQDTWQFCKKTVFPGNTLIFRIFRHFNCAHLTVYYTITQVFLHSEHTSRRKVEHFDNQWIKRCTQRFLLSQWSVKAILRMKLQ